MVVGEGKILQIGDVAEVGKTLEPMLSNHFKWEISTLEVPSLFSSRSTNSNNIEKLFRGGSLAFRAKKVLNRCSVDFVHLHWARYAPFVLTGKVPLLVHAHGSDLRGRTKGMEASLVLNALSKAEKVLVSTPDLLEFAPGNSQLFPNPVDCSFWSAKKRVKDAPENRVVFVHSRLKVNKGTKRILDIIYALRSMEPSTTVRILAEGKLAHEARLLGAEVASFGSKDFVRKMVNSSDVVIGQQELKVFGLSELEALACEKPVIMPINQSLYNDTMPILNALGIKETVDLCFSLLEDDIRREKIGKLGREYVINHHSTPIVSQLLNDVYVGML